LPWVMISSPIENSWRSAAKAMICKGTESQSRKIATCLKVSASARTLTLLSPLNSNHSLFDCEKAPESRCLSRDELIATTFGDEDFCMCGITLNLLTQAVNVGFQSVGRNSRIIAPHILQQCFTRDALLTSPI
jgi:hypothetical protein